MKEQKLKMLALHEYSGINSDDPIRFYQMPFIGAIFRKRVEKCLSQLSGGQRVLEIGFGSGVTFPNLNELYGEIHGIDMTADVEAVASTFRKIGISTYLRNGDVLCLPYNDDYFDSVLLISILEHLKPESLIPAFLEICRVLKTGGQIVYGVPVDKKIMNYGFSLLGFNIKDYHFSDHKQVYNAAVNVFNEVAVSTIYVWPFGNLYEVGCCEKSEDS
ncbi:MAG: class I SAM-dependent methyltransferase [Nitrospirae bacterium]|nr:MAG: class I SAM-dependent methyltransferase [Nitrospirota bacterium]